MDFLDYPKDPGQNILFRGKIFEIAEAKAVRGGRAAYTDDALRMQHSIRELAFGDLFFFFNTFLFTYDPRPERAPADKPFVTYDRQNDYLRWLERKFEEPYNVAGMADKPRDVGCTYLSIGWSIWHWLKDDSFNAHLGSRMEDLVDKRGDPDALFYKADYMLRHLPSWMLPEGFEIEQNHRHMIIDRPDRPGNTITGESANPSFGRSGRYSFLLMDEFGFWQWARAAWEACGESAHFRLAVTTPPDTGKSSHAYKLLSGQAGKVHIFRFNYSDVPWKDAAWLAEARASKSQEEFNREVLRSYDVSMEGKVYAKEWGQVRRDERLTYNPNLPLYCSWDFGLDGTAIIWWQKDYRKNWNYIIEAYMNNNEGIDFYTPFVTGLIGQGQTYKPYDLEVIRRHKEWKKPNGHFGDPDVKKRNMETMNSLSEYLAMPPRHIYVQTHTWTKDLKHYAIRERTKLFLSRCTMNPVYCQILDDAMMNARYPERREGSQATTPVSAPIHDYTSHPRTALEYYVLNEPDIAPEYARDAHPAGTEHDEEIVGDDPLSFSSLAS